MTTRERPWELETSWQGKDTRGVFERGEGLVGGAWEGREREGTLEPIRPARINMREEFK